MPKLTNAAYQRFGHACRVGEDGVGLTFRVFRAEHALHYDVKTQEEVEQILEEWPGGVRKPLCVVCENRLTTVEAPPAFVLAQPFDEGDADTISSILSGVCPKCSLRSDAELVAVMRRNRFGDVKWRPIGEPGHA